MYFSFFKQSIKFRWAYKINSIFGIIGTVLKIVASIYLWQAIFSSSPTKIIGGFQGTEMITYLILTNLVTFSLGSAVDFTVPYEIIEGFIGLELIKPYSYIKRHFFYDLGNLFTNIIVSFSILVFYLSYIGNLRFFLTINFIYFLISMALAYLFIFSFNMIIALFAFYTNYVWGIRMIKVTLISFLSGALIPLSFLPKSFEYIVIYTPFSYLSYYPTLLLMGKISNYEVLRTIIIQSFWAVFSLIFMQLLYKRAIKNLQILGG